MGKVSQCSVYSPSVEQIEFLIRFDVHKTCLSFLSRHGERELPHSRAFKEGSIRCWMLTERTQIFLHLGHLGKIYVKLDSPPFN